MRSMRSKADRRTSRAAGLRIVRFNQPVQLTSGRRAVDLSEEAVASGQLLLGGVLEVGKTSLHDRMGTDERADIVSGQTGRRNGRQGINQRFPNSTVYVYPPSEGRWRSITVPVLLRHRKYQPRCLVILRCRLARHVKDIGYAEKLVLSR